MSSGFEAVPISSQKHDPAWRHCHMLKDGDKVQLKCFYCLKIFRGGGIHRFKEHLACQKGNASLCPQVPSDVQQEMKQSLDGVVVKKRRKHKPPDDDDVITATPTATVDPASSHGIDTFASDCTINAEEDQVVVTPSTFMTPREEVAMSNRFSEKRRRGRPPKNPIVSPPSNGGLVPFGDGHGHLVPVNGVELTPLKRSNGSSVHLAVGRFLYDVGVPLGAVSSVYFQPMVDAIASEGPGASAPSLHDLRGWVLKSVVDEVRGDVNDRAAVWGRSGCSLLVEEHRTERGTMFLDFFVYCPEGTVFLKSVDITSMIGAVEPLFDLLKQVVQEVGASNVLQVITPNDEWFAAAGRRLCESFPTMYWAPCARASIVSMLEDFGKIEWMSFVLEQCRSITRFTYNHSLVLNMMRRHTLGVDLVVPDVSPAVASFRTVQRILDVKQKLQGMVTSQEWADCVYSKKEGGLAMLDLVSDNSFWSSCNSIVKLTRPLLRLLGILGSEKKPAMGYVYAGIYRAKETLKRELRKRDDYLPYWNIVDRRWEQHQELPLYAAGFYLNPKFFYSIEGDVPNSVLSRQMFDCIERLVTDTNVQVKICKELNLYKVAAGDFGRRMAISARESLLPAEWWSTYGGACPNLSRLAVRILGQCCSLLHCKRELIPLEQMHSSKNSLEHQRLSDQVFTQYNLRLRQMAQRSNDSTDPISVENHESVCDWLARNELCLDDHGSSDWVAVEPPSLNKVHTDSSFDEVEELGSGFDDCEIFGAAKEEDDTLAN